MDNLLDTKQLAERLSVSIQVIKKWRGLGIGPRFVKLDSAAVRYRPKDINEWLVTHRQIKGARRAKRRSEDTQATA